MRQIVTVNLGNQGIQKGIQFWDIVRERFNSCPQQEIAIMSLLGQKSIGPRSIFANLGNIRSGITRQKYGYVIQQFANKANYAQVFYHTGQILTQDCLQILREQLQSCQCPQAIIINSYLGDAVGSGMTSKLFSAFQDKYPKIKRIYDGLLPPTNTINLIPVYNYLLSNQSLIEHCDLCVVSDSTYLQQTIILKKVYQQIANRQSLYVGATVLRNYQNNNFSFPKLINNSIPFPRMHFLTSFRTTQYNQHLNIQELVSLNNISPKKSKQKIKLLNIWLGFFGDVSTYQCQNLTQKYIKKKRIKKFQWQNKNLNISYAPKFSKQKIECCSLYNSNFIAQYIKRISSLFVGGFRRKGFIHNFIKFGMDQMQFTQAQSNANDLASQYTPCTGCCFDEQEGEYQQQQQQ